MSMIKWSKIALFEGMNDQEVDKIRGIFDITTFDEGVKVITEGETGNEMFVLIEGRVRITKSMIIQGMTIPLAELQDPRKVLATLNGDICPLFGEMALLDSDTRSATVETLEPCKFLVTDHKRFFQLLEREPILGSQMLMILSRRLAATVRKNNSELVKLTTALALALAMK